jgi:hypothetical protein
MATAFAMGMIMLLFWGGFLGIVNGYNGWVWVLALMTGTLAITLLGLLHDEMEDDYEPRRTFTRTSSRTVHFERPHRYFEEEDY